MWQMYEERAVERMTEWRPRLRWKGDVREDLGKMKIQNGSKMAMERDAWKRIVEHS